MYRKAAVKHSFKVFSENLKTGNIEKVILMYGIEQYLVKWAVEACCEVADGKFSCFIGRIVTGDRFISDAEVKADIVERFKPMCVEMEGAAIAHVATANKIPFVVIRSMSDKADDSADMSFDEFAPKAAENSAQIIIKMLEIAR